MTEQEFEIATRASGEFYANNHHAVSAAYDPARARVVVQLSSGLEIAFHPEDVQCLQGATPAQLAEVEILGVGYGLHWESLDADVHLPSLLQGVTGAKAWMAERQGRLQAAE